MALNNHVSKYHSIGGKKKYYNGDVAITVLV